MHLYMAGVCIAERALDDTDIRVFLSVFFLPIRVGVDQSIQSGVDSRRLRNRRQISVRTYIYIYIFRAAELAMSDIKTDKAIRFVIYLQ